MRKRKGLIVFLILVACLGFGGWRYFQKARAPQVRFLTAPASRGDLRSVIMATGKVQPVSLISVGTQISGTLKELYVDYNSVVKAGQLIALIDPATQEAEVAQAEASLNSLRANLREAEANLKHAQNDLKRSRELYAGDLIARSELDVDETGVLTAGARVASVRASIAQQEASLRRAKIQLGYTRIYSPVDGIVVKKEVDVGQTVAASFNTPTIAEIAEDLSRMQVEVNIDEADIGSVREGQRVEFTVDAFPERHFAGTVTQIRLSPTTENNVISYTAIVSFENEQVEGKNLIPGMTANVTLIVEEKTDIVMVPNAALRFRPLSQQNGSSPAGGGGGPGMGPPPASTASAPAARKPSVYRLEGDTPVKIEVERGITDGTSTEIISGLEEGQQVITGIDIPKDA